MAEMGGDEARGEQQLFGEERHLLQARGQEREHNSSLRSGRSHGMRGPRMPGLGTQVPRSSEFFSTFTLPS